MKNERLLNAIGDIDEDLISEAVSDTRKKKLWIKWGSLAAVLVLCAGAGLFAAGMFTAGIFNTSRESAGLPETDILEAENPGSAADSLENHSSVSDGGEIYVASNSIVILDVNPSIALTVNTDEKIVSAQGLNDDGNAVLNGMDLTGVDMTVAVNAIIGSMLQKGYLSDLQNAILVSVENEDAEASAALQERISAIIGNTFQEANLEGSVLSQTLQDTTDLEQLAQEYQISLGKAALIQEVMSRDATLTVEKLTPLSITEIALISQSKNLSSETLSQNGFASDKAYISRKAAMEAACRYANVNAEDAFEIEIEFDSDDGIMVYEIEFRVGTVEYECDVNARTGQVMKYEAEDKENSQAGNSAQPPSGTQQPSGQYIGEDAAKEIALSHGGFDASQVTKLKAEFDYDDGIALYEVEYESGHYEYEYKIDAATGTILEYEIDD